MKITSIGRMFWQEHTFLKTIMRLLIFLFCTISFAFGTNKSFSQDADILIEKDKKLNVKQAFKLINKQTDFKFIYRSDLLKGAPELSVKKGVVKATELLDKFLLPIHFTYQFTENNTIIVKRMPKEVVTGTTETPVQLQISGTVVDPDGIPLAGASIVVKGTTNGAQTDFDGKFSLQVADSDAILQVSYVGFKAKEIPVGNQTQISIVLEEDTSQLDEVVVVGYGTQRRTDVAAAITSVKGDVVNETKESNVLAALAGKAAGVDINFNSNSPGDAPSILIRGRSSLSFSNEPLFVVDGIPVSTNLSDFNPNDIESIEILKDASATAIYGARGANGVVLITTKRGKVGKTQFSYESYYGFQKQFESVPLLDAQGWARLRQEAERTVLERDAGAPVGSLPLPALEDILTPQELEAFNDGVDTDWQDLGFGTGVIQNHQLGASGGSEKVRYNITLNYFEQEGLVRSSSSFERITNRINLDMNLTDRFSLALSQQIGFTDRDDIRDGSTLSRFFSNSPVFRAFEEDGSLTTNPLAESFAWNPLQDLNPDNFIDNERFFNYFGNLTAKYKFTDNLSYTLRFGLEYESLLANRFLGTLSTNRRGGENRARKFSRTITSHTVENVVNYNKTFNDVHNFDGVFLFSFQDIKNDETSAEVEGVQSETQTFNNLGAGELVRSVDSGLDTERFTSVGTRFNYDFDKRYFLTFSARVDGSSKLAEGNKFQFFPAASAKWQISNESFFSNVKSINNLGLSVGFGTVGRNNIDPFVTQGGLTRTEGSFEDNPAFGLRPNDIPNPNVRWEVTTTFNVGLDFGLFKNRISGEIDYYKGNTRDLLLERNLPATTGFQRVLENVGETQQEGFEVQLNADVIRTKDFNWNVNANFSRNRSTIVALADGNLEDIGNRWFVGEQLGVFFDRVFDGIWQLDQADEAASFNREVGQVRTRDLNGDGEVNDDDRQIVGFEEPQWTGGLTNTFRYKNWDLSVVALTRQGHTIRTRAIFANNALNGRRNNVDVPFWTPENPSNTFPRPDADRQGPLDEGAINYFDGSYIRIRNITLGHDFDKNIIEKVGLQRLRLYVTAQNPFLFRADDRLIDGVDPDVANNNDEWFPGARTILFGINTTF